MSGNSGGISMACAMGGCGSSRAVTPDVSGQAPLGDERTRPPAVAVLRP